MNRVIIIGAGASGLAAASRLVENGLSLSNITILESQNRIGGRIHTLTNDSNIFTFFFIIYILKYCSTNSLSNTGAPLELG